MITIYQLIQLKLIIIIILFQFFFRNCKDSTCIKLHDSVKTVSPPLVAIARFAFMALL